MADLTEGSVIGVLSQVMPGPFSGEFLISVDTVSGPVSGFVRKNELKMDDGRWYVRAVVQSIEDESLTVWIRGSFFTINGIAKIRREAALAA